MNSEHNPSQNQLLAKLDNAEFDRLLPHLELIRMGLGDVLYQSGGQLKHVYFPTTAVVSIEYVLENGGTSEIASVGCDGLLGISLFMGGITTPSRAVVQAKGFGYRLLATHLLDEFYRKGPVLHLLLRYTQALMTQMSQAAVCNSHHTTSQRLCRWLLQTGDRGCADQFFITQESIAGILGVRRESITSAAGYLQMLGLIKYSRGHVTILSRPGLEERACECYQVLHRESARLLSDMNQRTIPSSRVWRMRNGIENRRSGSTERRAQEASTNKELLSDSQTAFQFS